ncbi:hypothetical protein QYE76_046798 [Lolium multiflorum]|uniref:Uncharacterized protein n=1 Tax=Lolium multiflorum TaxID=4521 RepID=A0AAD8WYZ8_LOLMU|nr:hypothetical protein QYE76_046798 [Lolium multiflorum]
MAAEDLEWERSKISNQDTNMLKRLGMKKEDAIRFPSEESYPKPPMEYRAEEVVPSHPKAAYDPYVESLVSSPNKLDFDLTNPVDDPVLDALSYLELHGSEIREGVSNASAVLSALFPYFFPKKEEPATFLNLAKMFNTPEDLGLKMRQENMKLIFDNYTPSSTPSNVSPSSSRARRAFADAAPVDDTLSQELDELRQQLQYAKKQTLVMMEQSRKSSEAEKVALQQAREAVAAKEIAASEAEKATTRENFMLELMNEASADMSGAFTDAAAEEEGKCQDEPPC